MRYCEYARPRKQPRVASPLKELRPAPGKSIIYTLANPVIHESILALSPLVLQPAQPPKLQPAQTPALQPARPPVRLPSQPPIRRRFNNESRNNDQCLLSLSALEKEYTEHMQAEAVFPPDIDDINIHSSVLRYQFHMDSVIEGLKCVYGCCGLFVSEKESQIYAIDNCLIRNSITSGLLTLSHIDCCVISDNDICLCLTCSRSLLLGN